MANNARVLGIVLMHATGTTAGLFEMLKDKVCTASCRLLFSIFSVETYFLQSARSQM